MFALFLVFFPIQSYIGTPSNIDSYKSYWASRNVQNTTSNTAVSDITTPSTIIPIMDFISDGVFGRFDLSRTLGKIVLITNETGKFWNGKSLKNFFISLGPPRILWHSKPAVNTGHNEFGREFGIIAPNNYTTAVAPGLLGDWYLNSAQMVRVLGCGVRDACTQYSHCRRRVGGCEYGGGNQTNNCILCVVFCIAHWCTMGYEP